MVVRWFGLALVCFSFLEKRQFNCALLVLYVQQYICMCSISVCVLVSVCVRVSVCLKFLCACVCVCVCVGVVFVSV